MMKCLILVLCFAVSACAQFGNRQSDAVVAMSNERSFYTRCDGAFDSWNSCGKRAKETCPKGWMIIDQEERPDSKRMLMFQCYK